MKRAAYSLAVAFAFAMLVMGAGKGMADQPANASGTWQVASHSQHGNFTQTLNIQQDGNSIHGTMTGRRGESPLEGSVSGNQVNFTVKHQGQDGNTMVTEYTATIEGDSMKGKSHSERFGDREFKAKRTR